MEMQNGFGCTVPPDIEHVEIYFIQKGKSREEAHIFYSHYRNKNWNGKSGNRLKNWKMTAWEWIWN